MQITNHSAAAAANIQSTQTAATSTRQATPTTGNHGDATATVSSQSALIHAQNGSASDVRRDKVQSVQSAIASGSYHVDAGKVADKLIESLTSR